MPAPAPSASATCAPSDASCAGPGTPEHVARDTGLPQTDAQFDFNRQRRRRAVSRLASRLRRGDVDVILPYEEVVAALGYRGERSLGLQVIDLDTIVGTLDRGREFDRSFRPTSGRV